MIVLLFQQLPARRALIWSFLSAYLILPVKTAFDFPGVPPLDKTSIPNIAILICAVIFLRQRVLVMPKSLALKVLMVVYIVSPIFTALNNSDPMILVARVIPGMSPYDALASCAAQAITLIPFVLGYTVLRGEEGHRDILIALALAGLIYTLPMLYEVRMSPHLHSTIYGFFPHSFGQQMRANGFRPVVFIGHGLLVSIFACMSLLSVVGLWHQRMRFFSISAGMTALYLAVVLLLCKSLGAAIFAIVFAPLIYFGKPRSRVLIAAALALVILAYPALRGAGMIPTTTITSVANSFSTDREGSLQFRLDNEDMLLEKANQRPFFGWGTWGRNRVYAKDYDKDLSTTDGTWIIIAGIYGWVGYLAAFGILCFPFLQTFKYRRSMASLPYVTTALYIVLIVNLLDLIPNSSLTPITWLIAGAVSSVPALRKRQKSTEL